MSHQDGFLTTFYLSFLDNLISSLYFLHGVCKRFCNLLSII